VTRLPAGLCLTVFAAAVTAQAENSTFEPPAEPPRLTARAATAAVDLDGRLDEPDWQAAPATGGFVQIEPQQGQPAAEGTTVRVLFDGEHLYFAFDCIDSAGRSGVRSPDFGRDFDSESFDHVAVVLDPFSDGRSAQVFAVTSFGVQRDLETAENGTRQDEDWNAAWTARAHFTPTGWSADSRRSRGHRAPSCPGLDGWKSHAVIPSVLGTVTRL
jgi:hypothetical protein